ncbi:MULTISPECIES: phosphopentomutase [unclassified Beijerinckia]|uniref:phosphopentomutase n=1 Tax=unclassified Beijerinckia TaxID=2638183 RepID=UPI00089765A4|nr:MULTISPECIES: phosphopentomutase [unclassified Beijerinckia]MDH7796841.1 phosphopentomutase [Beijerinckia sp. GAS462]SEC61999.1 phosphopentomutase [Beijerinckia sp. 28-YEA-48]
MARAFILVLDSFGCGGAADAAAFGDAGADTLGHIAQACAQGRCDIDGIRQGELHLPVMSALGLGHIAQASTGQCPPGLNATTQPGGAWGYGVETSRGKDTPSGHWEIAGAPAAFAFGYFPPTDPAFPPELVADIIKRGHLPGILGDTHASGIAIIDELGEEHLRSGKPILYTSVDSVLQIAAHEEAFGRERLYDLCALVRELVNPLHIARVIARPFVGTAGHFHRTPHRRDYSIPPPLGNILDRAGEAGRAITSIGKIGDIFAHRNCGEIIKGDDDNALLDTTLAVIDRMPEGGLVFANYVDLDTDFGHRRNVAGYALGLEAFDRRLNALRARLRPGDLCILTADHGNDPTWPGTDHTREHVPILAFGPDVAPVSLGRRETFADIGASVARHLGLPPTATGKSWL